MRRALAIAGLAVGLALVAWAMFGGQNDEERIAAKLDQFAASVAVTGQENIVFRATRLNREFEDIFEETVTVQIPELTSLTRGRKGLAQVGARAGTYFQSAQVDFESVDIALDEASVGAVVRATAQLDAMQGGRMRRDERSVIMRFVKRDDEWKISSLSVGEKQ